jgi:sugar phosphate isomerase/epimerase
MRIGADGLCHLTYCTNIHPGETWEDVERNVRSHVTAVKARISPERPFGVGLRLSAQAAGALARPETLEAFADSLTASGLYVFTINGFPYGRFHGVPVKEQVYRPDWLEEDRLVYSDSLAKLLARLLPSGAIEGSVSTVPGCFRDRGTLDTAGAAMADRLLRHAATLWRLRENQGTTVGLALEPEPECVLETIEDAVRFFKMHLLSMEAVRAFSSLTGLMPAHAEEALRRHLGLCLDACHAAVEFEDAGQALAHLHEAGIRVLKLQVSAGLRVLRPGPKMLAALARFAEDVYLHQVVIRRGATLTRTLDLPEALRNVDLHDPGDEWRIHFHVPIFREELGPFSSTQAFVAELLERQARAPFTQHLEVETYTWDVLPEEFRQEPVVDAVARELRFALGHLGEPPPR